MKCLRHDLKHIGGDMAGGLGGDDMVEYLDLDQLNHFLNLKCQSLSNH
jgi:hypothetical protein